MPLSTALGCLRIARFLLIALYVQHQRSYDTFYPDVEIVYKIVDTCSARMTNNAFVSVPLGPDMVKHFPEVVAATRLNRPLHAMVTFDAEHQFESQWC